MRIMAAALLLVLTLTSGCSPRALEPIQCGHELLGHGQGYDGAMRDCLWQAYEKGRPAQLTSTAYGIEGGEYVTTFKIAGKEQVEYYLGESTDPIHRILTCSQMERHFGAGEEKEMYRLVLTDCGAGGTAQASL